MVSPLTPRVRLKFFLTLSALLAVEDDKRVRKDRSPRNAESQRIVKFYCCGNHLSQRQMITQAVNLLVGYQVGNSQENSTRSLCLISVLFIQMCPGPCYHCLNLPYSPCFILMFASLLTQGHHVYSRCPDIIFQILLPYSRPYDVTCLLHRPKRKIKIKIKSKEK